jgi:hypothetical protein
LIRANRNARERKFGARATKICRLSPRKIRSRHAIVMLRPATRRRRRARASAAPEALATAHGPHIGAARVASGDSWNRLQNKASP